MRILLPILLLLALSAVALAQAEPDQVRAIQAKLAALEQAHRAGILDEAEYRQKKAEFEAAIARARAPKIDAATAKKLAALEVALQAGIITRDEYGMKKAALLGGGAARPAAATPRGPAPVKLARYADPDRRFQFLHPAGLQPRTLPKQMGASIIQGKGAVSALVWKNLKDGKAVVDGFANQIAPQWKSFKVVRRTTAKLAGHEAHVLEFVGNNTEGQASHGAIAGIAVAGRGYSLARIGPDADYAALGPTWEAVTTSFRIGGVTTTGARGKLYRHAIGFSFWHPADWTVKEENDFLRLVPPNSAKNAQGDLEAYFIVGDTVAGEGITRADDPKVAAYMDEFVRGNLTQLLQRSGTPQAVAIAKGTGTQYDWRAKSPSTGKTILARAYTVIIKEYGMSLLAFGMEENLKGRDAALRRMFGSFGFGAGQKDPKLVGTWTLSSSQDIWNTATNESAYTRARGYNESKTRLEIRADGTWVRTHEWQLLCMGGGTNAITGTVVMLDSGPQREVTNGTWCAGGGVFYRSFKNGSWCDEKYEVRSTPQGAQLVLQDEKTRNVWTRK